MRFGIRVLVFALAVAPFTWAMVTRFLDELSRDELTTTTMVLAPLLALLSAGYIYSIVEGIYGIVSDANDRRAEAREDAHERERELPPRPASTDDDA